jgi:hypothetical protein
MTRPTPSREGRGWPGYLLGGRIRTSTVVLLIAFVGVWWLFDTYQPAPAAPEQVPATEIVPPGFIPDPAYTWAPRTAVQPRPTPTTTTPTTTTPTTTEGAPSTTPGPEATPGAPPTSPGPEATPGAPLTPDPSNPVEPPVSAPTGTPVAPVPTPPPAVPPISPTPAR